MNIIVFALIICVCIVVIDAIVGAFSKRTLWTCVDVTIFALICWFQGYKIC